MTSHRAAGAALLVVFLASPAFGVETLTWKFKEGESLYIETVNSQKQTVTLQGNKQVQELNITSVNHFTIKKTDKDGTVLEQKIESIDLKSTPALPTELAKLNALKGSTLTLTLDATGKVTKLEGYDEMIRRVVPSANDPVGLMIRTVMSEQTLKQALNETFNLLPDKPVNKGDTWKRESGVPLGPFGTLTTENVFTYQGPGKEGDEITVKPAVSYAPPKTAESVLPFKIAKGELKIDSAQGTILFDNKAGKLVRQDLTFTIKGGLTIEANEKEIPLDLQLEQKIQTRLTDKPPAK
jgi:hypothetical protein